MLETLRPGWRLRTSAVRAAVLPLAAILHANAAHAQGDPRPDATLPTGAPSYGSVDDSTVRVFSVGTVGIETFDVGGREVKVAEARSGHGTGFLVGARGLVLTARHVVEGARHVVVRLPGHGGFFGARVVLSREDADVAVLKINAEVEGLRVSSDTPLRIRQPVFAIGYPIDAARRHPQSARGIIAGHLEDGTLQLDMALNPGNSGGPLLDEHDRIVGMVVARGNVDSGIQGIGFAVPAGTLSTAVRAAQRRIEAGEVEPLSAKEQLAAVVVDELIQQGSLHPLRQSTDLATELRTADFDQALDALLTRIDDPDLLVFVAGALWNAALGLEVAGLREIGQTRLTDAQAIALAERLRSSSIEACRRAVAIDASVRQRSSFLGLALGPAPGTFPATGRHPSPPAPEAPRRRKSVLKQWWFWIVVGVGVVTLVDIAASSGGGAQPLVRPLSDRGAIEPHGAVLLRF